MVFARLRRTASVWAIIVTAYAAYRLLVLPFVEPSIALARKSRPPVAASARTRPYDHLFPRGSWELARPKVIETEQGTLYFADYEPLPDGRLKLTRCTVIAHLQSPGTDDNSSAGRGAGRPILLRAPQGAILTFDQNLSVLRAILPQYPHNRSPASEEQGSQVGRIVGGQLTGEVTIHSPPSSPGSGDALDLVTKNVQIDPQKIWTPHDVRFRYGPNSGNGRVLTIHLATGGKTAEKRPGLGIGGVRALELVHLDRLELLFPEGLFGKQKPGSAAAPKKSATPVEVRCRGPLRFDMLRQLLTLEDRVDLTRRHPSGVSDQLICELLQIHFSGRQGLQPPRDETAGKMQPEKLTPTRIVATGQPVIIRAGSAGIGARAERIEFDCVLQRVWLQDRDKVLWNDRQREVDAKELRYTLGQGNRLGELWAQGPGIVRGEFGPEATRFDVIWQDEVQLKRVDSEPVLSFNKRAQVKVAGFGQLTGDTLYFYLREVPRSGAKDRVDVMPDRLHVVGNVQVDTDSCHGKLREAKIWFKPDDSNAQGPATRTEPAGFFQAPPGRDRPPTRYDLRADVVEAVVRMRTRPVADLVIVRGGIELREIAAGESQPLRIRGEHFELQEGASLRPRAALLGTPAEIRARGAAARGKKIHLHPVDNFLEIVGAGTLSLPARHGDPHATGESLPTELAWNGQMQFDGQRARFEREVSIRGAEWGRAGDKTTFVAMGDVVHIELTERLVFQNVTLHPRIELLEAAFEGWGFLQTEMFAATGDRKLFEQMQVLGLTFNQQTGDLHGHGPGWLRGVHRGNDRLNAEQRANDPNESPPGLSFLRVDFERQMAGNLRQQRLEFLNGTKTLYGPVSSWDQSLDQDPTRMVPPGAMQLTSDRLAVAQAVESVDAVELEAVGNVHIQGDLFVATGGRASYAQQKDQFILEGDGRNDARIEYHSRPGAPPSFVAARKILYWPKTRQCQGIDVKPAELHDLGQLRGRGAPAIRTR